MKGLIDTIEDGIPTGRVTTLAQYFEENPQSVYRNSADVEQKSVMINGQMIVVGSVMWNNIADTAVYQDTLFGELRWLYHTKGSNIKRNNNNTEK